MKRHIGSCLLDADYLLFESNITSLYIRPTREILEFKKCFISYIDILRPWLSWKLPIKRYRVCFDKWKNNKNPKEMFLFEFARMTRTRICHFKNIIVRLRYIQVCLNISSKIESLDYCSITSHSILPCHSVKQKNNLRYIKKISHTQKCKCFLKLPRWI